MKQLTLPLTVTYQPHLILSTAMPPKPKTQPYQLSFPFAQEIR